MTEPAQSCGKSNQIKSNGFISSEFKKLLIKSVLMFWRNIVTSPQTCQLMSQENSLWDVTLSCV